jgi:hypothetical protein
LHCFQRLPRAGNHLDAQDQRLCFGDQRIDDRALRPCGTRKSTMTQPVRVSRLTATFSHRIRT